MSHDDKNPTPSQEFDASTQLPNSNDIDAWGNTELEEELSAETTKGSLAREGLFKGVENKTSNQEKY